MIFGSDPAKRELAAAGSRYARPEEARWADVDEAIDRAVAADPAIALAAARARAALPLTITARLARLVAPEEVARFAAALVAVPRERFVRPEEIGASADDAPSPLDQAGRATVSAPHAYVLTYQLLGLREGDHLVELGTGTGYGAALASHVVGPRGRVTSIEIDPALHARARRILAAKDAHGPAPITLLLGDARALADEVVTRATGDGDGEPLPQAAPNPGAPLGVTPAGRCATSPTPAEPRRLRVAVTYALPAPPEALLARLPEGGVLVAPVGAGEEDQRLFSWIREDGALRRVAHGAVRYVAERR